MIFLEKLSYQNYQNWNDIKEPINDIQTIANVIDKVAPVKERQSKQGFK